MVGSREQMGQPNGGHPAQAETLSVAVRWKVGIQQADKAYALHLGAQQRDVIYPLRRNRQWLIYFISLAECLECVWIYTSHEVYMRNHLNFLSFLHRIKMLSLLALLLFALLLLPAFFLQKAQETRQRATSLTGEFAIQGNKIYAPTGQPFIVKGMTAVWGRFVGAAKGVGLTNYNNAQRDLDSLKALGVNLVRVFVSAYYASLPHDDPNYLADYMQEIDNVVLWTTQRGMVAELANSKTPDFNMSLQFVSQLATRYRDNPYVWIEPMNEPNCDTFAGDHTRCFDWSYWQAHHKQYVQAIRNAGMTSPIIVNTIDWSADLSQIGTYQLNDSKIIYGVHRYANQHTSFTAAEQAASDRKWANLSGRFPIIIDEVGAYDGGNTLHLAWNQGFIDYVTNWVNTRGGAGAIAYLHYGLDDNAMTGDWRHNISNGVLNQWGDIFYNGYLRKVTSSILPAPTLRRDPTPTPAPSLSP